MRGMTSELFRSGSMSGPLTEPCCAAFCGVPAVGCQLAPGVELFDRVWLGIAGPGWPGFAGALLLVDCMVKPLSQSVHR